MSTEGDGDSFEWEYADYDTYEEVVEYLNSGEVYKIEGGILRSEAGLILEKVEENYLEPRPRDTGLVYL
jgi:hypothetical protein